MSTTNATITANMLQMERGMFGALIALPTTPISDLSTTDSKEFFYGIVKGLEPSVVTVTVRDSVLMGSRTLASIPLSLNEELCGKFDNVSVASGKVLITYGKEATPY